MRNVKDLTGKIFGRLTVIKLDNVGKNKRKGANWLCICSCGTEKKVSSYNLGRSTQSCGCLLKERVSEVHKIRPYEALYNNFVKKSTVYGHTVSITYENFLEFTKVRNCHYCLDSIFWTEFNLNIGSSRYNLDRKGNNLNYTVENCVVCCWRCNESKGNRYTYEEWCEMTECFRRKRCQRD